MTAIEVNGRSYRLPERPTVVICYDGCDPAYIERGLADSILPTIAALRTEGFVGQAKAALPTFTNPNNVSIVTGVPPAMHGISGNYVLDRATGEERMITDAALLRCGTILAAMADAGVRVAAVTAKDKLLRLLAHNLRGIAFSAEHADRATRATNGIADVEAMVGRPKPDQYSADLSLFVLDAGLHLLRRGDATLLYLSLSDYVQHAYAPGEPEADAFNRAVDERIGQLIEAGAIVAAVADHGMNDKCRPDGSPNVVYLEAELNRCFGEGAVRVICPIADPFVRHHGALGSFVRVYLRRARDLAGTDGGDLGAARGGGGSGRRNRRAPLRSAARSGGRFRRVGGRRHGDWRDAGGARPCRPCRTPAALAWRAGRADCAVHLVAPADRALCGDSRSRTAAQFRRLRRGAQRRGVRVWQGAARLWLCWMGCAATL